VVASIEHLVPWMARTPGLANALAGGGPGHATLQAIGLVQTPKLSGVNIDRELQKRGIGTATPKGLRALSEAERACSVVVVQDAFTSYYETALLLDLLDLIQTLGFRPWLAPYRPNGKALHVHGFLGTFERAAAANAAMLQEFAATGVELVGLDPSMTLTYRSEYPAALGANGLPAVSLVQEWLVQHREALPVIGGGTEYQLLPHCTERTTAPAALRDWSSVFSACGLRLTIVPSGCCGMAGTWGHEAQHRATSEHIYALSWAAHVAAAGTSGTLLEVDPIGGTRAGGSVIGIGAVSDLSQNQATRACCCSCGCGPVGNAPALSKRSVRSTALASRAPLVPARHTARGVCPPSA
jgi:(R)-2-hydroxyglutarate dehydrogenase